MHMYLRYVSEQYVTIVMDDFLQPNKLLLV